MDVLFMCGLCFKLMKVRSMVVCGFENEEEDGVFILVLMVEEKLWLSCCGSRSLT